MREYVVVADIVFTITTPVAFTLRHCREVWDLVEEGSANGKWNTTGIFGVEAIATAMGGIAAVELNVVDRP